MQWGRLNRFLLLMAAIASLPVIVNFAGAALHGWWPQGDDAVIALKVGDVFSSHPPVMGMRATTGIADPALSAHHPGPLEFYLLAIPSALVGFRPLGLLLGTAGIGVLTLVAVAVVARRRGGAMLAFFVLTAAVAVQWALGPDVLFRPFNPYPSVLPVLLMLLLAWSLLADDLACMWGFALTASFIVQSHLAYFPPVAALTAFLAAVGCVRWYRRRQVIWPWPGWRPVSRSPVREGRRALVVLGLCWLPVLIETLRFHPNNISLLARYMTSDPGERYGWHRATALVTAELAPIPGGFSSLSQDNRPIYGGVSLAAQILGVGLVVALLLIAVRRHQLPLPETTATEAALASIVAVFGLAVMCAAIALIPVSGLPPPRYYIIALWPVVCFAWAVLAWTVGEATWARLSSRTKSFLTSRVGQGQGVPLILIATAALLACNSPVKYSWADVDLAKSASSSVVERVRGVEDSAGPVRIEAGGWIGWGSLSSAIAYRLRLEGHPVYVPLWWPYPQDEDFRKLDAAPPDSTRILIREKRGGTWNGPDPGAGATPAFTRSLGSDASIEVYVEPGGS